MIRLLSQRLTLHAGFLLIILVIAAHPAAAQQPFKTAAEASQRLGNGINLGNMLEAPAEGEWGAKFRDHYAARIQEAGFQHVRLPVRWSAHTAEDAPWEIDQAFMDRVRHVVDTCVNHELAVVLNVHHFNEMYEAPDANREKLKSIWRQISEEFSDASPLLCFELLNEPHDQLTGEMWDAMIPGLIRIIREKHPRRPIVVGGGSWNSHDSIHTLKLPGDDRMLIATFHYYLPFAFTHQGAPWVAPNIPPTGRGFPHEAKERQEMADHFAAVRAWSEKNDRPVYVGEFGSFSKADQADRVRWTKYVTTLIRENGFSSAYWEFCSGFGAYDPQQETWRAELLEALSVTAARRAD